MGKDLNSASQVCPHLNHRGGLEHSNQILNESTVYISNHRNNLRDSKGESSRFNLPFSITKTI
jgi:hypothetical protein